jgi:hypothetical protein
MSIRPCSRWPVVMEVTRAPLRSMTPCSYRRCSAGSPRQSRRRIYLSTIPV